MFSKEGNRLIFRYDAEKLWIEPWGANALRVRATKLARMPDENWALQIEVPASTTVNSSINTDDAKGATITNGHIKATVSPSGKIMIYNTSTGQLLMEE